MIYALTKVIGSLLTVGGLLLTVLTIVLTLLWMKRERAARRLLIGLLLSLLIVLVTPLEGLLAHILEDRFPANPPLPQHIDGIIVLGGAVDQYLSQARHQLALNDAAERMVEGLRLARSHPEAKLLLSGGAADPLRPEPREATIAAAWMLEMGIEPERLVVEDRSRNTAENALYSAQLAQPKAGEVWLLITTARHMPRSVGVFRHYGWNVLPWPVDFSSDPQVSWTDFGLADGRLGNLSRCLHEWAGLAYYRARGWTDAFFPSPD